MCHHHRWRLFKYRLTISRLQMQGNHGTQWLSPHPNSRTSGCAGSVHMSVNWKFYLMTTDIKHINLYKLRSVPSHRTQGGDLPVCRTLWVLDSLDLVTTTLKTVQNAHKLRRVTVTTTRGTRNTRHERNMFSGTVVIISTVVTVTYLIRISLI